MINHRDLLGISVFSMGLAGLLSLGLSGCLPSRSLRQPASVADSCLSPQAQVVGLRKTHHKENLVYEGQVAVERLQESLASLQKPILLDGTSVRAVRESDAVWAEFYGRPSREGTLSGQSFVLGGAAPRSTERVALKWQLNAPQRERAQQELKDIQARLATLRGDLAALRGLMMACNAPR